MFGCNETITLWKRSKNSETGKDEFTRTVLPVKCKWRTRSIRTETSSGANTKYYAVVVIPWEIDYQFDGKIDDYIALGEQTVDITGEKPYRADDVKELLRPNFFKIENVKDLTMLTIGRRYEAEGLI